MISNATTQAYTIRFSSQSLVDRVSLYNFWWPKTQSSYSFGAMHGASIGCPMHSYI